MVYGHHMGGAWWAISIVVLLTAVAAIVFLVRMRAQSPEGVDDPRNRSPRAILDHRLAIGDIDEEEYRSLLETLAGASSSAEECEHASV